MNALVSSREREKVSKVQKKSDVERRYFERRFRGLRCIYGARCFSATYDGGKRPGLYFKVTECSGQASDALSAHSQVKMKDSPELLQLSEEECRKI